MLWVALFASQRVTNRAVSCHNALSQFDYLARYLSINMLRQTILPNSSCGGLNSLDARLSGLNLLSKDPKKPGVSAWQ